MRQLDPRVVWLFFFSFLLRWSLGILFLSLWGSAVLSDLDRPIENMGGFPYMFFSWLLIIPFALVVACFIWARLTYYFYRYELTEEGFRKELGVIYKKYVTIPYDRIQNVDIYRGILARIFGLSDLNVQTAGYSSVVGRYRMSAIASEGRLPGLSREVAEQLRNELIKRTRQTKNQGL